MCRISNVATVGEDGALGSLPRLTVYAVLAKSSGPSAFLRSSESSVPCFNFFPSGEMRSSVGVKSAFFGGLTLFDEAGV